jgi:multiple sugar transport system permease protein
MALTLSGRVPAVPAALRKKRRRHRLVVLAFLAPWIIGFLTFFGYPFAATTYYSLTRYDLLSPPEFVGLLNYKFMFTDDPTVWIATKNTLWLVALLVPAKIVFALGLASILTRLRSGLGIWRSIFYLPALAPPVAATIAFVFLLNPEYGVVNNTLGVFGIDDGPGWFTSPSWSKPSLTLLALWGAGDVMIILLAALLDVPKDLYDAADVDGAGPAQRFRFVTLPTIAPVLGFAAITGVIQTLQYFTQAAVAAGVASNQASTGKGGSDVLGFPEQSTLTYPLWLYVRGFGQNYLGYAAALAMALLVVAFALTALLLWRAPALMGGDGDKE